MTAETASSAASQVLEGYRQLLSVLDGEIQRLEELEARRDRVYQEYTQLLSQQLRQHGVVS